MYVSEKLEEGDRFYLKIIFFNEWAEVRNVRNFVKKTIKEVVEDRLFDQIITSASELVENACKYSCFGNSIFEFTIDDNHIDISVKNFAVLSQYQKCKEILEDVHSGNPRDMYERFMRNTMLEDAGKHLGLARIRFETNAEIKLTEGEYPYELVLDEERKIDDEILKKFKEKDCVIVHIQSVFQKIKLDKEPEEVIYT